MCSSLSACLSICVASVCDTSRVWSACKFALSIPLDSSRSNVFSRFSNQQRINNLCSCVCACVSCVYVCVFTERVSPKLFLELQRDWRVARTHRLRSRSSYGAGVCRFFFAIARRSLDDSLSSTVQSKYSQIPSKPHPLLEKIPLSNHLDSSSLHEFSRYLFFFFKISRSLDERISRRTKNTQHVMSKTERNLRDVSFPLEKKKEKETTGTSRRTTNGASTGTSSNCFIRYSLSLSLSFFSFPSSTFVSVFPSFLLAPPLSRTFLLLRLLLAPLRDRLILRAAALPPEFIEAVPRFFQHLARCWTLCGAWHVGASEQWCLVTTATSASCPTHAASAAASTTTVGGGSTLRRFRF